jgi:hypothetical protein
MVLASIVRASLLVLREDEATEDEALHARVSAFYLHPDDDVDVLMVVIRSAGDTVDRDYDDGAHYSICRLLPLGDDVAATATIPTTVAAEAGGHLHESAADAGGHVDAVAAEAGGHLGAVAAETGGHLGAVAAETGEVTEDDDDVDVTVDDSVDDVLSNVDTIDDVSAGGLAVYFAVSSTVDPITGTSHCYHVYSSTALNLQFHHAI